MKDKPNSTILDELYKVIESRRGADPKVSRTATLFEQGIGKIAKKTGEEAVEVIVAALNEKPGKLVDESADLLYHLLVLWAERGVKPTDVYGELQNRFGVSAEQEQEYRRNKGK